MRRLVLAAAVLTVLMAIALASTALATKDRGQEGPPSSYTVSAKGTRLQPPTRQKHGSSVTSADLYLLGIRGGRAFYRIGTTGASFAIGDANAIGTVSAAMGFDRSQPLWDVSVYELSKPAAVHGYRAEGFAADGISGVAYLDASGKVTARAPVTGNIFSFPSPPQGSVSGIEAFDSAGNTAYRRDFARG